MKSKSPFSKKSPLQVQVYQGDTYEQPDTVITKTVGEQVGKAITGIADNAVDLMDLKGKLAYDKKNPKTQAKTGARGGDTTVTNVTNNYGGDNGGSSSSETESSSRRIVREVLPYETGYKGKKMSDKDWNALPSEERRRLNEAAGANKKGKIGHDGYRILEINKQKSLASNSPSKLIGDTMDPYGQINKNDLTGMVDPNQPQALGNRDFRFNQDPIAPGRLGSASSVNTQNQIFGGGQAQTAAEQLQTPLAHKTETSHTEPHSKTRTFGGELKKGDPYIVADYEAEGGKNPPDTLNLAKFKQPDYMKNPGKLYEKGQYPDEDIFDNKKLNNAGFNTDSTSSVKIFKGN